jgi:AraC-like DNA-binding protein
MLRPINIRRYLALMEQRGFAPASVLAGTRIRLDRLNDADYLVDLEQCQAVVANMVRLSGDPSLGLSLGFASRIADFGIVGHALLTSGSIRHAAALWLQYSGAVLDMLIRFELNDYADGSWRLKVIDATSGSRPVFKFCTDELLGVGMQIGRALNGEPMRVKQLKLSYQSPGQEQCYRELFGCEPEFGARQTEIVIASPQLDHPLRHNSDELSEICLQHCSRIMQQNIECSPVLSRLRSILLRNSGELPTIAQSADALGMSERTLRRRLLDAGVTYQQVLDEFRCDLATEYFCSAQMKPKQVAYLLGYKNVGNFRRAFKSWTGKTVGDFLAVKRPRRPLRALPAKAVEGSHRMQI